MNCYHALRDFVLDEKHTERRSMKWGNDGAHREPIKQEFLRFFQETFVPRFLTAETLARNDNLSGWKSVQDPDK